MAHYDLEEQEHISALKAWWERFGNLVTAGIVLAALSFAGWQGWQWYRAEQAAKAALVYGEMTRAVQAGDLKKARDAAGLIIDQFPRSGYAPLAALAGARLAHQAADAAEARARLQWVLDHARDPGLKDVARLRLASVLLDEKQYDDALKLLDSKPGDPQANLFADLRGDVLLAKGSVVEARAAYQTALERSDAQSPFRNLIQIKIDALGDGK